MAKSLKVSVIIPTLNEEKHIARLLGSVNAAKYKNKEIIVVDGGSKDRTVEIAKSKGAKVVYESGKVRCPANAKNVGVSAATGDILLELDADTYAISKNFIKDAMAEFEKKGVAGVAPANLRTMHSFWPKAIYHSRTLVVWAKNLIINKTTRLDTDRLSWFPNFTRRRVFWAVGGYNIDGVEDQGFLRRYKKYCEKKGLKTVYLSNCKLYSQDPQTLSELLKQVKWYARVLVPSNKKAGPQYLLTFFLSILQPLFFVSIFLVNLHPVFALLAIPYIAKLFFLFLYVILFRGVTYNSKHFVFVTIVLDLISWPWKIWGILEYVLGVGEKETIFSRRE